MFLLLSLGFLCGFSWAQEATVSQIESGNNLFAADLYKGINQRGNLFFSPFSLTTILALVAEGSGSHSAHLSQVLHLPQNRKAAYKNTLAELNEKSKFYDLYTANRVYIAKKFSLNQNFESIAKSYYQSDVVSIDFNQKAAAAQQINQWVESKTNKKIQNLLSPNSFTELTRSVLINTLYFKGNWTNTFNTHKTSKEIFHLSPINSIQVDTMYNDHAEVSMFLDHNLNATFINLPYLNSNLSMTIILPLEIDGLERLEENVEQVLEAQPQYETKHFKLRLPRFSIKSSVQLGEVNNDAIRSFLNIKFPGIIEGDDGIEISDALQKTFVNVTESGTEAAAATAIMVGTTSVGPVIPQFLVNHPFIFHIKWENLILFVGRVENPNQQS